MNAISDAYREGDTSRGLKKKKSNAMVTTTRNKTKTCHVAVFSTKIVVVSAGQIGHLKSLRTEVTLKKKGFFSDARKIEEVITTLRVKLQQ